MLDLTTMARLKSHKILILGGTGFVGLNLRDLLDRQDIEYHAPMRDEYDAALPLRVFSEDGELNFAPYDLIFNLMGYNGGIEFGVSQAQIYDYNVQIHKNAILKIERECRGATVINLLASCAYDSSQHHLSPLDITRGLPHKSMIGHGLAKRVQYYNSLVANRTGRNKYLNFTPSTLFGPYGSLDPKENKLVNAIILKMLSAARAKKQLVLLGSGRPIRDIVHVETMLLELLPTIFESMDRDYPYHLNAAPFAVAEIAKMISKCVPEVEYTFNQDVRMDGQYQKSLVPNKFSVEVDVFTKIKETVDWYRVHGE